MGSEELRRAAGWFAWFSSALTVVLFALGTWTGPLEPFVDDAWPILAAQALSVVVWVGVPALTGWLLLGAAARSRVGAGLFLAYGLPVGPGLGAVLLTGGPPASVQLAGFALLGAVVLGGAVIALVSLLSDPLVDLVTPGGWSAPVPRWGLVAAGLVLAVLTVFPLLEAADAQPAFVEATAGLTVLDLIRALAILAVACLAAGVSLPATAAAMAAGIAVVEGSRLVVGVFGLFSDLLGTYTVAHLMLEGAAVAAVIVAAVTLGRERMRVEAP